MLSADAKFLGKVFYALSRLPAAAEFFGVYTVYTVMRSVDAPRRPIEHVVGVSPDVQVARIAAALVVAVMQEKRFTGQGST